MRKWLGSGEGGVRVREGRRVVRVRARGGRGKG